MVGGVGNIGKIPELRKRIVYTILMLGLYRIFVFIPVPGVNKTAIRHFFANPAAATGAATPGAPASTPGAGGGTLFNMYDMFSGGALQQFSVITLGIMPYISASIILQLLGVVIPHLENLQKEGQSGMRKITQYTRYGSVGLTIVQGAMIAVGLSRMAPVQGAGPIVLHPGIGFILMTIISLTAGSVFVMWIGEQISDRGIGNGISLIIFAGIVARMPSAIWSEIQLFNLGQTSALKILGILAMALVVIGIIIFCERGQRKIPVQYAKRVVGRKMYGGQSTHLPLKINTAGVIPPIFASSIIMFPATILTFWQTDTLRELTTQLRPGGWLYTALFVVFNVFFTFFYTAIMFNPVDVADNMKKYGGFVPGIRAGKKTAEYIDRVMTRITVAGAAYLTIICVLPNVMNAYFNVPFYFGGTSLLIVVEVAIDTLSVIESHLLTRHYDGLLGPRGARLKNRRMSGG